MGCENKNQVTCFGWTAGAEYLKQLGLGGPGARVLFVTGKQSFTTSGAERFLCQDVGMEMEHRFSEFSPNPTCEEVQRGIEYFDTVDPDCIVAVGGGSALDMAKLLAFFGSVRVPPAEYLECPDMAENIELLPIVAIPTTSGSGSEATEFAVLYKEKKKFSVAYAGMLPTCAILIPELTASMSPYQLACCGFDAFSQAIESYWAVGADHQSRIYSAAAISLCMQHLEEAVLNPTPEHREGLMKAAHVAGQAINLAKTTAAHAFSYTLTSFYELPHGHAVAMMLPWVLELNAATADGESNDPLGADHVRERIQELCELLHCESPAAATQMLRGCMSRIGLSDRWLSERGVDLEEVRDRVARSVNFERLSNNPRALDSASITWLVGHIR